MNAPVTFTPLCLRSLFLHALFKLSQINVLEQKINLEASLAVQVRIQGGRLRIYYWCFDIAAKRVFFSQIQKAFCSLR
jgi:hypothetical protein